MKKFKFIPKFLFNRNNYDIGFLVCNIVLISHYESIILELKKQFKILLIYTDALPKQDIKAVKNFSKKQGISIKHVKPALKCNIKIIIANHYSYSKLNFFKSIKIRLLYGLGKNAWMFRSENKIFDYHLVYGDFSKNMTARFASENKIFKIGYPRFDSAINTSDEIIKRMFPDFNKEIIAWLPTHSVSSIPKFVSLMKELNKNFAVVAFCHSLESKENIDLLEINGIFRIKDRDFNNAFLMKIAKFVFCDYGGSMFGAIYMKKNLVLLNSTNPKEMKTDSTIGVDTVEFEVRKKVINFEDSVNPDDVLKILNHEPTWKNQLEQLESMNNYLFEPYYGNSGKIAAEAINDIYNKHFNF